MDLDERLFVSPPDAPHRWSGWPGAWCLDCGIEDQLEICLSIHGLECEVCKNPPCTEPGSNRHNPYVKQ